jgi:uncharacterized protein (TIGR03905 family)
MTQGALGMSKIRRYIYQTQRVCPPEIHFQINDVILESVRFVGGGCPGNAQLVARLLERMPVAEVLPILKGIECSKGTSCPDQLAEAIRAMQSGDLRPVSSFRVEEDSNSRKIVGLIGELNGDHEVLRQLTESMAAHGVEAAFCAGNLMGPEKAGPKLIKQIDKSSLRAVTGARDWVYANEMETAKLPFMDRKTRDFLIRLPQVIGFRMEGKKAVLFFGDYLQTMPGYSDFEPFALEINMVCGLTDFMRDETVFPALEAMIPQFQADIIIFSQTGKWGHWHLAGKDFISMGPAADKDGPAWARLEIDSKGLKFNKIVSANAVGV